MIFQYLFSGPWHLCSDFLGARKSSFGNIFNHVNRKKLDSDKFSEYGRCCKALSLARYFLTVSNRYLGAFCGRNSCLYSFFQMFNSHCIPNVSKDYDIHFFVYSMPSWNKFIVDKTLSLKENLLCSCSGGIFVIEMISFSIHVTDVVAVGHPKCAKIHIQLLCC
jgi:hypothetical protein